LGRRRPFILFLVSLVVLGGTLEYIGSFETINIFVRQIMLAGGIVLQDSSLCALDTPLLRKLVKVLFYFFYTFFAINSSIFKQNL